MGVGASLSVVFVYALGTLLQCALPLSGFEATLLMLLALMAMGGVVWQSVVGIMRLNAANPIRVEPADDAPGENVITDPSPFSIAASASNPRWQRTRPNEPCSCGSQKKYKHGHGKATRTHG